MTWTSRLASKQQVRQGIPVGSTGLGWVWSNRTIVLKSVPNPSWPSISFVVNVLQSKADIRAQALGQRAAVPAAVRSAFAKRLAVTGPSLVRTEERPFADPIVSIYQPIKDEADTTKLIDVLAKIGLTTALPITIARGQHLLFRSWKPGEPLEAGPWGIGHPLPDAPMVEPDVLFVPLAAFDRRGSRIGYGAGYYDATLAVLRRKKSVRAIGIAFACQEVLFVPAEPHDEPLDIVVTERDIIMCEL